MGMSTPWGTAQTKRNIARGIIAVDTAGHGGIHLSPTLNAQVHEAWRDKDGWYEEDCDWAIVALTFPQHFSDKHVEMAHACAKRWHAKEYAQAMGVPVPHTVAVGQCPTCGWQVETYGGWKDVSCCAKECDTRVQLRDEERIYQPTGEYTVVEPAHCDHQTGDLGCQLPTCWGAPPAVQLTVGQQETANRTADEPGIFALGRAMVDALRRALRPTTVTAARWGETAWERDRTVRFAHGFELAVGVHEVQIASYLSRNPLQKPLMSYLAAYVDSTLVAAGIPTTRGPDVTVAAVVRAVTTYVHAAAERAASYSHMYERPSGPIVRTVYAAGDRVMVRFDGEKPYVLSHMWTAAKAREEVDRLRRAQVDSDHDWGLAIDRAMRSAPAPVEAAPRIADVVKVQYAYESANDGSRVDIIDEAGARAVIERFGHAIGVRPAGDGMSLLVATPTERGPGGSHRLHAMACDAGLLAVIVDKSDWEAAATTPHDTSAMPGDAPTDDGGWQQQVEALLPYCAAGEPAAQSVSIMVDNARAKLAAGVDPEFDLIRGEAWAGLRPRDHIVLAMRGEPVPPIDAAAAATQANSPTKPGDGVRAPVERIARRVTIHEARRHFEAGGTVLVSEYGHEPTCTVGPLTTTHNRTRITWDDLVAQVRMWRGRYPNQRFYVVPDPVQDNEPAPVRVPGEWGALLNA